MHPANSSLTTMVKFDAGKIVLDVGKLASSPGEELKEETVEEEEEAKME